MAHRMADDQQNETAGEPPRVTVRYWAAARAAAGFAEETLAGRNVAEVLTAAVQAHGGDLRFERVLRVSSILVGEAPVGSRDLETVVLESGDVLEILPPFAGG